MPLSKVKPIHKHHGRDAQRIASLEPGELKYVCRTWVNEDGTHLSKELLQSVMKRLGRNGKPTQSRNKVEIALIGMGYTFKAAKSKPKQ